MGGGSYKQHKKKSAYQAFASELSLDTVTRALLPAAKRRFGPEVRVDEVAVEHLKKPVFTCALQMSGADQTSWTVIAKKHAEKDVLLKSYGLMEDLWRHGFSGTSEDGISSPEPLHLAEDIQFLFMEAVPGEKLRRLLKSEPSNTGYIRQFARTLAKLHRCPISIAERITLRVEYEQKAEELADLGAAYPGLRDAIGSIVAESLRIEEALDVPYGPVHGTYNLGQLHILGDRCWILDFDGMRFGDPAWDVANVLSDAMLNQEKSGVTNGQELLGAFRDEYFSSMDPAIGDRVPLYETYYRLKRACKYHRSQEPERLTLVEGLVQRASDSVQGLA